VKKVFVAKPYVSPYGDEALKEVEHLNPKNSR
jgi:hypothetical protein